MSEIRRRYDPEFKLGRYGLFWRLGNRLPRWPGIWVFIRVRWGTG